jgi:predicted enzyme related to lactoylglutathione lyase
MRETVAQSGVHFPVKEIAMPTFTAHTHGTFSWIELATTDTHAAKHFYGALFGWSFDHTPMGDGMMYATASLDGKSVGAIFPLHGEMSDASPQWTSYVAVDDIDKIVRKVRKTGGAIVRDAFDIPDMGRMAVIQDPTGAVLCLWQAKEHIGVGMKQEPGSLCWNELMTSDTDVAGAFFARLFGWERDELDMGDMGIYTLFTLASTTDNVGGMVALPGPEVPPHWMVYIGVADCETSAQQVVDLGGTIIVPPTEIPDIGCFAIAADPHGATFGLFYMNVL